MLTSICFLGAVATKVNHLYFLWLSKNFVLLRLMNNYSLTATALRQFIDKANIIFCQLDNLASQNEIYSIW